MNLFNIPLQLSFLREKKYDTLYWAIDIHSTILKPTYGKGLSTDFYPMAKEVLQFLTKRIDHKLIMNTCSFPYEIEEYVKFFNKNDIHFDFINENPEAKNTRFGCFDKKFYFSIILDDKGGFEGYCDWNSISEALEYHDRTYKRNPFDSSIEGYYRAKKFLMLENLYNGMGQDVVEVANEVWNKKFKLN